MFTPPSSAPGAPNAPSASTMTFDGRAVIDGARVAALSGETFACLSPIDGKPLTQVARCREPDIHRAVESARKAFESRAWSGLPPVRRKAVLFKFAELIVANKEQLALTECMDMGKPLKFARAIDVAGTANCVRWYAEAIDKVYGEIAPTGPNALALISREAVGVVGAIVPWNYPMSMASWKFAPALAVGCSVVLKPSEKSPLSALVLADLALQAGLPPGVFNVVPGFGPEAGAPLASHMDVDCIAFTGSTKVGKLIHVLAGQSNLKPAWTELGGKSPNLIFADCVDLDRAVAQSVASVFFNQGESCNAPSRLLVEKGMEDAVMERALKAAAKYKPGNPLDEKTLLGAIVDEAQLDTVMRYIELGKDEGASLALGGKRVLQDTGGYYVEPTIFAGVTPEMTIAREEIFGPVLSILSFEDAADAVRQANDSIYGLQAAVWTRDLNKAHAVSRALRAGTVHVNSYDEDDMTVPFGGFRQSGVGRDKSLHALDKYSQLKTTWIRLDPLG